MSLLEAASSPAQGVAPGSHAAHMCLFYCLHTLPFFHLRHWGLGGPAEGPPLLEPSEGQCLHVHFALCWPLVFGSGIECPPGAGRLPLT